VDYSAAGIAPRVKSIDMTMPKSTKPHTKSEWQKALKANKKLTPLNYKTKQGNAHEYIKISKLALDNTIFLKKLRTLAR
jgi:hypothetical protein